MFPLKNHILQYRSPPFFSSYLTFFFILFLIYFVTGYSTCQIYLQYYLVSLFWVTKAAMCTNQNFLKEPQKLKKIKNKNQAQFRSLWLAWVQQTLIVRYTKAQLAQETRTLIMVLLEYYFTLRENDRAGSKG